MRLPRMKEGDLVVVKVYDLTNHPGWLSDEKAQNQPLPIVAISGWFINKDKHAIRISSIIALDGDKAITVIPRGSIKMVKVISYDRD